MTPLHRLWRYFPPGWRRYGLSWIGGHLAPAAKNQPDVSSEVLIGGEIFRASGLGEGARIMQRALRKENIPSWMFEVQPYKFSRQRYNKNQRILADKPKAPLVLHVNAPQLPYALLALPRKYLFQRKIIGYWAWELPVISDDWKPGFRCVHEIWVPSIFTAQALEPWARKYKKIIRIVPHALAATSLKPVCQSRVTFGLPENALIVFVSFNLASSFVRKNPLAAIQAFRKAFGNQKDRVLLLKISHAEHYPEDMAAIQQAVSDFSNVIIKTEILSASESLALMASVDIVLSLHRSEGFGLVPAEGMMLGKAVISTNWSATAEFLDDQCGMPIHYRLIPVKDPRMVYQIPNALWADPDIDHAAQALIRLADNPEYRLHLGQKARKHIMNKLGTKPLKDALIANGVLKAAL